MKIVIRVDYPELNPQGIKEAIAMRLEPLGQGIHVVEVQEEQRQESLWTGDSNGKWLPISKCNCCPFECSECGIIIDDIWTRRHGYKYCPNCGTKMEVNEDGVG